MTTRAHYALPPSLAVAINRAPDYLLPLLLLTIPLEFTKRYFPLQIIEVGRLVIVACLLSLLLQSVMRVREIRLPALRLWLPPPTFIGYAALSAVVVRSSPGLKTVAAMLTYALMALMVYTWTRDRASQNRVWVWLAISCIGLSVVVFVQKATGGYIWNAPDSGYARINATFADPNILGRFLTFCLISGAFVVTSLPARWQKLVVAASVVLAAAALPFTFSRQSWAIAVPVLIAAIVLSANRRQWLVLGAAAIATFAIVTTFDPDVVRRLGVLQQNLTGPPSHYFQSRTLDFLNWLPLDSERHYLIAAGLQMFFDHPIFGVGFGAFSNAILGPYHAFILTGYHTSQSHTSLITIMAELGVVGLVVALWWLFEFARSTAKAFRSNRRDRAYIVAPVLALLVIVLDSQLSGRLVDEPYLWLFLGLAAAAQQLAVSVGGEPAGAVAKAGPVDPNVVRSTAPGGRRAPGSAPDP